MLQAIGAELLGGPVAVTAESGPVLGLAQTFFAQGAELLRNPGRTGGWDQVDVPAAAGHRTDVDERGGSDPGRRRGAARLWLSS